MVRRDPGFGAVAGEGSGGLAGGHEIAPGPAFGGRSILASEVVLAGGEGNRAACADSGGAPNGALGEAGGALPWAGTKVAAEAASGVRQTTGELLCIAGRKPRVHERMPAPVKLGPVGNI